MTFDPMDPNRPLGSSDPYANRPLRDGDATGWGLPLAVVAVVLIIGGLFMFGSGEQRTSTASNEAPITRSVPTQTPAAVPPTTPPVTAPKQ